ncbi:MAG: hypothetical protein AUJ52_05365 [Elusimicrobia bacterium CG1_02_63_36]|nr:MAG: hypothetical protein AUJ52_05365 [Elusimicrobia bacterium CG1_02_63_36]PIP81979.1 MAG: hypothetical protein COR54_17470 [Elusimicrobia bacterium CG22_combo_CG10-13_8_21_14_all_63_91]PJA18462.1 MAG: hypothetical protein COX66_00980 [Elusimicrobia bacterium CG_4_10_14_0_2_um_filter_63_34]PJB24515.1 MAG: hypothetical protein CO113_13580 [Elusimicrobia bacterium CG_4_9_14_3_um_filter_62_55]
MLTRRLWFLSTASVYALLVAISWSLDQGQAHAASAFRSFNEPGQKSPSRRKAGSGGKRVPYRKISRTADGYALDYGFKNFNGDSLDFQAELDSESVAASIREFGFKKSDFDKLDAWYKKAQKDAVASANARFVSGKVQAKNAAELKSKLSFIKGINAGIQKELDGKLASLSKQYRKRRLKVYEDSGFRYKDSKTVEVDIPAMVSRNWKRVRPVAHAFAKLARAHGYDQEELVGAATAWVQTAIIYEVPADNEGSRTVAGIMPPLKTLILGQGDCDTKTALLASVLLNWPKIKMVGLGIPGHYLMAYQRPPRRGDIYLEYKGLPFVMIESAGPAWLNPGDVGASTKNYLKSGKNFRIQPMGA